MLRAAASLAVAVAVLGAASCSKGRSASSPEAGSFADSPFLALIPADTPYAFLTFKATPPSYFQRLAPLFGKIGDFARAEAAASTAPGRDIFLALLDEVGPSFDEKRANEIGLTLKARWAFYGADAYPVGRLEIADGNKLFATIQRVATKAKLTLPPPTERDGRRYWTFAADTEATMIIAVGAREVVGAMLPTDKLAKQLPYVLGVERPAKSISGETFRNLAQRHGFSAYGVGFAESARVAALAMERETVAAPCRTAIDQMIANVPRIAFGYGDLSQPVIEGGMVVELAPELITAAKGIGTQVPHADTIVAANPLFAMSAAVDINKSRALAGRIGQAVSSLGAACQTTELDGLANAMGEAAVTPLPPAIAGIRGFAVSVTDVELAGDGPPKSIDGFAAIYADDAPGLLAMASALIPQLATIDLRPDGQPKPVLEGASPYPIVAAMRAGGIAMATGDGAAKVASDALTGKPVPAPLLMFHYDYGRFFAMLLPMMPQNEPAAGAFLKDFANAFGPTTLEVLVDDRGVVMWGKLTMK